MSESTPEFVQIGNKIIATRHVTDVRLQSDGYGSKPDRLKPACFVTFDVAEGEHDMASAYMLFEGAEASIVWEWFRSVSTDITPKPAPAEPTS